MNARTITSLAIVGLLVVSACGVVGASASTDMASVICTGDETIVGTPAVNARANGVTITIDNRTGDERLVVFRHGTDFRSKRAVVGVSAVVLTHEPGTWSVVCTGADGYPAEDAEWSTLEVHDPGDLWVAHDLPCANPTSIHPDYQEYFDGALPTGTKGDPLVIATAEVNQWFATQPGDEVKAAGYPEANARTYMVVRDGIAVAVADYRDDGAGGWFFGSVAWCEDAA